MGNFSQCASKLSQLISADPTRCCRWASRHNASITNVHINVNVQPFVSKEGECFIHYRLGASATEGFTRDYVDAKLKAGV